MRSYILSISLVASTVFPIAVPAVVTAANEAQCTFPQTLRRGSQDVTTGGQVTPLQRFLARYFALADSAVVTGYYGKVTEQYVTKFQSLNGLPAYGITGTLTRTKMQEVCQKGQTSSTGSGCAGAVRQTCPVGQEYVAGPLTAQGCATPGYCRQVASVARFTSDKTEGTPPLTVTFSALVGGTTRYAVNFGDGSRPLEIACPQANGSCVSPGTVSHTYGGIGVYTATLVRQYSIIDLQPGSVLSQTPLGSIALSVTNAPPSTTPTQAGGQPPTVTSFTGPTQLTIQQSGTWSLSATDPDSTSLWYGVDWGDGSTPRTSAGVSMQQQFSRTAAPTHTYATAGTYALSVWVKDERGNIATSSSSVTVDGGTSGVCQSTYTPVCGSRSVCGTSSCWSEQKTYSNSCYMTLDNAQLVSDGSCPTSTGGTSYVPAANCQTWFNGCNRCSRSTPGGSPQCGTNQCQDAQLTAGYCVAMFGTSISDVTVSVVGKTATITGPSQLTSKASLNYAQDVGCGYAISWGDNAATPAKTVGSSCAAGLSHTYTVTGTHTVQASLFHPDTSGAPITDWSSWTHAVIQ